MWFNLQRQIHDLNYNKARWVGPCSMSSLKGSLIELEHKVNKVFVNYECIQPQFLKRFCGELLE